MYELTLRETETRFAAHLDGAAERPVCVLSDQPLSTEAKQALVRSAEQLGYGRDACFFAMLTANAAEALDPKELFELIEGIDPLVLIAADDVAIQALQLTYNARIAPQTMQRVFGRTTLAFRDFQGMLASPQDKQRAWAALKLLKRSEK